MTPDSVGTTSGPTLAEPQYAANGHNAVPARSPREASQHTLTEEVRQAFAATGDNRARRQAAFGQLAAIWREDTLHLSSPTQRAAHWAYRLAIQIGKPLVPYLLREMQVRPDFWFSALRTITGANPVPHDARGDLHKMTEAWLNWGREQGQI